MQKFINDPRVKAAATSLWVTAIAIFALLYTDAAQAGQVGDPLTFLLYCKAHLWGAFVAIVIAPAIRTYQAHQGMQTQ